MASKFTKSRVSDTLSESHAINRDHSTTTESLIDECINYIDKSLSLQSNKNPKTRRFAMIFHGGAGAISLQGEPHNARYKRLGNILQQGYNYCIDPSMTPMDIVEKVIMLLEDEVAFNAGKGSVYTNECTHELEASIMDGATLKVGCVGLISDISHPISLAKLLLIDNINHRFPHSMLFGEGAVKYAKEFHYNSKSIQLVNHTFFDSEKRYKQFKIAKKMNEERQKKRKMMQRVSKTLKKNKNNSNSTNTGNSANNSIDESDEFAVPRSSSNVGVQTFRDHDLDISEINSMPLSQITSQISNETINSHNTSNNANSSAKNNANNANNSDKVEKDDGTSTVGCCAWIEGVGCCAGTSTGGLTFKRVGRIGDTPIIGAGNYANNKTLSISGTGIGEYFIRHVSCFDVHSRMLYLKQNINDAMIGHINDHFGGFNGDMDVGGFVGIDCNNGNFGIQFNSTGMNRGYISSDMIEQHKGKIIGKVGIWKDAVDYELK